MLVRKQADDGAAVRPEVKHGIADLSERQLACLSRAGEGLSSKEIGRLLGISPSTVDNHIHVAVAKLNARNRWEAARLLQPKPQQNGSESLAPGRLLPPLGGAPNTLSARKRFIQILAITIVSIIVLTSSIVLVLGAIAVFETR